MIYRVIYTAIGCGLFMLCKFCMFYASGYFMQVQVQVVIAPLFCGEKNKCSVNSRGKERRLHNFAGQSQHCSIIWHAKVGNAP